MNPQSPWFDGFESRRFEVNGASIQARFSKVAIGRPQRPALLLLHGFPPVSYTHLTLPTNREV